MQKTLLIVDGFRTKHIDIEALMAFFMPSKTLVFDVINEKRSIEIAERYTKLTDKYPNKATFRVELHKGPDPMYCSIPIQVLCDTASYDRIVLVCGFIGLLPLVWNLAKAGKETIVFVGEVVSDKLKELVEFHRVTQFIPVDEDSISIEVTDAEGT